MGYFIVYPVGLKMFADLFFFLNWVDLAQIFVQHIAS